jgi:hypothetical protein
MKKGKQDLAEHVRITQEERRQYRDQYQKPGFLGYIGNAQACLLRDVEQIVAMGGEK